jgi:hypothetical protein
VAVDRLGHGGDYIGCDRQETAKARSREGRREENSVFKTFPFASFFASFAPSRLRVFASSRSLLLLSQRTLLTEELAEDLGALVGEHAFLHEHAMIEPVVLAEPNSVRTAPALGSEQP